MEQLEEQAEDCDVGTDNMSSQGYQNTQELPDSPQNGRKRGRPGGTSNKRKKLYIPTRKYDLRSSNVQNKVGSQLEPKMTLRSGDRDKTAPTNNKGRRQRTTTKGRTWNGRAKIITLVNIEEPNLDLESMEEEPPKAVDYSDQDVKNIDFTSFNPEFYVNQCPPAEEVMGTPATIIKTEEIEITEVIDPDPNWQQPQSEGDDSSETLSCSEDSNLIEEHPLNLIEEHPLNLIEGQQPLNLTEEQPNFNNFCTAANNPAAMFGAGAYFGGQPIKCEVGYYPDPNGGGLVPFQSRPFMPQALMLPPSAYPYDFNFGYHFPRPYNPYPFGYPCPHMHPYPYGNANPYLSPPGWFPGGPPEMFMPPPCTLASQNHFCSNPQHNSNMQFIPQNLVPAHQQCSTIPRIEPETPGLVINSVYSVPAPNASSGT